MRGKIKKTYPVVGDFNSKEYNNHLELEHNLEQDNDYEGGIPMDDNTFDPSKPIITFPPHMDDHSHDPVANKDMFLSIFFFALGILFCLALQYVIYGAK